MHQYKLVIYAYTREGAIGGYVTTLYADDPEKCKLYERQYDGYQTDEDGNPLPHRKYKVDLYILGYNKCEDKGAFYTMHRVE